MDKKMTETKGTQDMNAGAERKKEHAGKSRRFTVAMLVIGLFCMAGAAAGVYFSRSRPAEKTAGLVYESNVIMGDIPGKSLEERQRELDSVVEEGMLAMSMNATPSGRASGADRNINWLIENPSNQGKLIRVEITRDDTGEKIYETGAIPPGSYVESAPPDTRLEAGSYDCTAVFLAYREDSEEYVGQAAVKIELTLLE